MFQLLPYRPSSDEIDLCFASAPVFQHLIFLFMNSTSTTVLCKNDRCMPLRPAELTSRACLAHVLLALHVSLSKLICCKGDCPIRHVVAIELCEFSSSPGCDWSMHQTDARKCPIVKTSRSEEWEHREVWCDSCELKELMCYFMCNDKHAVLLRGSDEF